YTLATPTKTLALSLHDALPILHAAVADPRRIGRIHRIADPTVGGDAAAVFTREAVTLIHEASGGVPRIISVLCDNALVTGYAEKDRKSTRLNSSHDQTSYAVFC